MNLNQYANLIESEKKHLYEIESGIYRLKQDAIRENGRLEAGDIVQVNNRKYQIIETPDIRISPISDFIGEIVWDLVYIGLRLKPNGQPYHDSQYGQNRTEIWQSYLTNGVAVLVSRLPA